MPNSLELNVSPAQLHTFANSLYRMTTSEMQIMTYLWNSKEPAIASQIVSDLIPTQNCTWKPRSVFSLIIYLRREDRNGFWCKCNKNNINKCNYCKSCIYA